MAFFLILALNVLVFIGINAARIIFSLYGINLGASPAGVGGVMAMLYVFPLLLSWPIGVLSDRFQARWLLVGSTAVGACGMLVPYLFPVMASLYVAAALLGLSLAFTAVMGQSLIGSLSKPEQRTRNFSNYAMSGSVSIFVGPLFAGFMIDHFGYRLTCAGISIVLLSGVAFLLIWGKALPRSERKVRRSGNLLRTLADRRLWGMLAISSLSQLGNDIFQIFLPIYAHGIGLSASVIGVVLSVLAAGSLGVRIGMAPLIAWLGENRLLAIAFYSGAAVFVLVPLATGSVILAILAFVFGICQGCTQPLTMMLMFNSAEEGRAGEAIGLRMTVNNVARIVGPALFGGVASLVGLLAVFWINGLLMATGGGMSDPGKDKKLNANLR
jgi:MFS family permease